MAFAFWECGKANGLDRAAELEEDDGITETATPLGLTAALAAFAEEPPTVPDAAVAAARRAVIDTVGVMLAGRRESVVGIVAGQLADGDEAMAIGGKCRLSATDAALLDGTAGHVLDYDDVAQHGHPSVVIVPALLAEAQRLGSSGRALLEAYAIGFETWAELGRREPDAYHLGSWHPTPILGVIAATAAVAALNRLDADRIRHALAIASSMASGVIANFGTHMKALQAGRAAAHAIEAVQWARAGAIGAPDAIEGKHGLLAGISPRGQVDLKATARLGRWRLVEHGLNVKRYPVCYASHRAVDGVIDLATSQNLTAGEVASVQITMGPAQAQTLRFDRPTTGLEARFSIHHNVAAALRDRRLGFAELDDNYVTDPRTAALYSLTSVTIDDRACPEQAGMAMFDRVRIRTHDGRMLDSGAIRYPRGHARLPLSDAELDSKFLDCARHGGVDGGAMLDRLHMLADLPSLDALIEARHG